MIDRRTAFFLMARAIPGGCYQGEKAKTEKEEGR